MGNRGYLPVIEAVSDHVRKMVKTTHCTHTRARLCSLNARFHMFSPSHVQQIKAAIKRLMSLDATPYRTARLTILSPDSVGKESRLRGMQSGVSRVVVHPDAFDTNSLYCVFLLIKRAMSLLELNLSLYNNARSRWWCQLDWGRYGDLRNSKNDKKIKLAYQPWREQ